MTSHAVTEVEVPLRMTVKLQGNLLVSWKNSSTTKCSGVRIVQFMKNRSLRWEQSRVVTKLCLVSSKRVGLTISSLSHEQINT